MEFIDCNTRIGRTHVPLSPLVEPTVEALQAALANCGVVGALCRHEAGNEISALEGNCRISSICKDTAHLYPVYTVLPFAMGELGSPDEFLWMARRNRVRALRIFPKDMGFSILPAAMTEVCELAEALHVPICVDVADAPIEAIWQLAEHFPKADLLLTAIYYRNLRKLYPLMRQCSNIYLESGFLKTFGSVEDICLHFGAKRLVFGSGAPYYDVGAAVTQVLCAKISEEEKKLIACENLKRLCGGEEAWN